MSEWVWMIATFAMLIGFYTLGYVSGQRHAYRIVSQQMDEALEEWKLRVYERRLRQQTELKPRETWIH